jgi:zinc/manganese transport system substrate-binding protein
MLPFAREPGLKAQHSSYAYLWRWLGMQQVADLEPLPGMAPTPGHLQRVLVALKQKPPAAIVLSSYQDPRPAKWLHERMPMSPVLVLPATVADADAPDALGRWFDGLIASLSTASQQ